MVLFHQGLYCTKLLGAKSKVSSKCYWLKPELCREIVAVNVHMARLIGFVAIEIEPIWATSQSGWHCWILQNCAYSRIGID